MHTDPEGKLYVYLPENTLTTAVQTTDEAADPTFTIYRGSVQTSSSGAAEGILSAGGPPEQGIFVGHSVSFTSCTFGLAPLTINGIGAIDTNIATAALDSGTVTVTGVAAGSTALTVIYGNGSTESVPITVSAQDFIVTTENPAGYIYSATDCTLLFTQPGSYTVSMATPGATTTTNRIIVAGGTAADPINITLDDVKISATICALEVKESPQSYLNLTLPKGTTNILSSGNLYPGIKCMAGATLTINGPGALTANGGDYGAGIGGGSTNTGGIITLNGGTITANAGLCGAGIGGGWKGAGGTIDVSSGTIMANGGNGDGSSGGGAGIGGGSGGSSGMIYISGGTVRAAGGSEADSIGNGQNGSGDVILKNKPAAEGGVNLYLTTVTLEDGSGTAAGNAAVTLLSTNADYSYDLTDMKTGSDGKLYLYLPENTLTTAAQTTNGAADPTYTIYRGSIQTSSSGAAAGLLISGAAPPTQVTIVGGSASFTASTLGLAPLTITAIGTIDTAIATAALDSGTVTVTGVAGGSTVLTVTYSNGSTESVPVTVNAAQTTGDFAVATTRTFGTDYTYIGGVLTFISPGDYTVAMTTPGTTTTTDRIIVAGGTAANPVNISLDGVKINSGLCALEVKESPQSCLNLTLQEGTTNILTSGSDWPGIKCMEGATLTINGPGALTANGGQSGAGIGGSGDGSNYVNSGNIAINCGTVTAAGGDYAAGIGGGNYCGGGNITISGGTVTATGRDGGAGIGNGGGGGGSIITISGGTVTANGGSGYYGGAGIGGGGYGGGGNTITISGGTVTANGGSSTYGGAGIGGGGFNIYGGDVNITVSGGTVKAAGGSGADNLGRGGNGSGNVTLMNKPAAQGGVNVYLTTITLENVNAVTAVTSLTATLNSAPYTYGMTDMFTDAQGKLYLYLPENTSATAAQTTDGTPPVTKTYTGAVTTINDHTGAGTLNAPAQLPAPTGLSWDGGIPGKATWSAVANASSYTVQLYKGVAIQGSAISGVADTAYDFTSVITSAGTGDYTFKVTVVGNGVSYTDSDPSAESAAYSYTAPPTLYPATVTVKKDGSAWASGAPVITIGLDSGSAVANGSSFANGTYNIYADGADTGVDITVNDSAASAALDYYTLTLNAGTGISGVSGAGVYISGASANIDAVVSDGYTWEKWSDDNTTKARALTINGALTLTASASLTPSTTDTTISPDTGSFDKYAPADVTATITWGNATGITDVKANGISIGAGNYSVSGDALTIKKEYLAAQTTGSLALTVEFNAGAAAALTVTISDTTPPAISPVSRNYDLTAPADVTTAISWNSASSVTDVVYSVSPDKTQYTLDTGYYTFTGSTLTILNSFFSGLSLTTGDALDFVITFNTGATADLAVNVVDGYVPGSNADLSSLSVNGTSVSGFDPDVTEYDVELPYGLSVATVTATASDVNAQVGITQAASLPGTATVTVTAEDGTATKTYQIHITIGAAPTVPVTGITVTGMGGVSGVQAGNTLQMLADVSPANATDRNVTWSIEAGICATIDTSGLLTATSAGSVTVRATANDGSGVYGEMTVTISAAPVTTYTVTFNNNGSVYAAKTVNAGTSIGNAAWTADPARNNYTFGGWFTGENGTGAQFTSATPVNATMTVYAKWTYSGGGSSGGGNSPAPPTFNADVKAGSGTPTTLPVTVDKNSGIARIDTGSQILTSGGTVITIPLIPDIDTYSVGIQVSELSKSGEQGTLTFETDIGSITVPSNMLTGAAGISGSKAEISVGQGDKDNLPDDVKAAIGDKPLIELTLSVDGQQTGWNNPSTPVTVSIPYTPTAEELANPENIVIWYIDGSGNVVTIPNGHYNPATGTVTFQTTHFSDYAVAYNSVSFNDVAAGAWYNKAVGFIAARGITYGTGNGNFSPEAKLTRGQFIVMLMKAYGIAPAANPTDNFADAGNTYYTGYLAAAKRLRISAGVGNNLFAPEKDITRQDMFTLLYNALKVIGQLPEGDSGRTLADFTDAGRIDAWAKEAMTLLVKTGTVGGYNGQVTPQGPTTRAEMAQVLYNLLGE